MYIKNIFTILGGFKNKKAAIMDREWEFIFKSGKCNK